MAQVTIEVDENEYNLFDYSLAINGEMIETDDNFTSQDGAYDAAQESLDKWRARKVG